MLDQSLLYAAGSDRVVVCSDEPTDYDDAVNTLKLATTALTSGDGAGDFEISDGDVSGRMVTMTPKTSLSILTDGDATHVALVKDADLTLRYVTTCTLQALVSGGTVDIPQWKIKIPDPV